MAATELREKLGAVAPAESISWLNVLIYSDPGVGKTHLLGTAEDHPSTGPLLVLDIDGGISTLRKRPDVDVIQVRSLGQLAKVWRDLFNAIPSNGKRFPYGTIGIDTLTELQSLDLQKIMVEFAKTNDKIDKDIPDQRGYGKSLSHMREIIRMFRDLPCNVIFNCHAINERDDNMKLLHYPKLTGQLKVVAPGFLDIVGYYRAEAGTDGVKRFMQFQATNTVIAKDRTGAFDAVEIDPTIPSLWQKLQLTNEGETSNE
jgi:phage nucleotide-binding protein